MNAFRQISFCLLFPVLAVALSTGCGQTAPDDDARLKKDVAAVERLERINRVVAGSKNIPPDDFAFVRSTHKEYPNAALTRLVLKNSLIARADWAALLEFLGPESALTADERIVAASARFKIGEFLRAIDILEPVLNEHPNRIEARSLAALCRYSSGDAASAVAMLEPVADLLVAEKRKDDLTLLGLAYLNQQMPDDAIRHFERVQAIDASDVPSSNGLSRAYYAKGDLARSEEFRKKTDMAMTRLAQAEQQGREFVQQSYKLEAAWKAKRFDEVILLARRMLPRAEANNKAALYQYIIESNKALGNNSEAETALAEARRELGEK